MAGLFDWLKVQGPDEEQKDQLEQELEANKKAVSQQPITFFPSSVTSEDQALPTEQATSAPIENQPIFQARSLAEKNEMLKEYKALEDEEAALQAKYGDFDPFNSSLEDFKAAKMKFAESATSTAPATPRTAPWTIGQEVPKELGLNIRSSVSSTNVPDFETPEEEAEKLRKDEYEKALRKAEEGNFLSALLSASSQAGKAIAGEGRIDQTPDDFRSVAGIFGKDKRINEAIKERLDKDNKFSFEKNKYKEELAQKREWMQLQKEMHRESVAARKEAASLKAEEKKEAREAKLEQELEKRLFTLGMKTSEAGVSSRSPLGLAYTKLRNAERLDPILYDADGKIKDKNKLNLAEAATGIAALIGGGNSPAQETINKFFPETAGLSIARLKEWITSTPADVVNSKEFLQMYATIVENEKKVAMQQIKEQINGTLKKAGFDTKDPKIVERFSSILEDTLPKAEEIRLKASTLSPSAAREALAKMSENK